MSSELWADPIPLVLSSAGRNTGATSEDQLVAPFGRDGDESTVEIAFVNNMPDSAFEATEQQFIGLLERATTEIGDTTVVLHRYGLPGLSRSEEIEKRLADDYRPLEDLYRTRPDGLIVTGTEPRADDLRNEPYWEPLARQRCCSTASIAVPCPRNAPASYLNRSWLITRSPRDSAISCASPILASMTCRQMTSGHAGTPI